MVASVLVIGGSGYLGSSLVRLLTARNHRVNCIVRSVEAARKVEELGASPVFGNLANPEKIQAASVKCDVTVLLAATRDKNRSTYERNVNRALLESSSNNRKGYIFTSGVWVYGDAKDKSVQTEADPLNPLPIAIPRAQEDMMVLENSNPLAIVLRPGYVFGGPGIGSSSLKAWIKAAAEASPEAPMIVAGDGKNKQPWIHLEDCTWAYCKAIENIHLSMMSTSDEKPLPKALNVTDGHQFHTADQVVTAIFKSLNKPKTVRYVDLNSPEAQEIGLARAETQAVHQVVGSDLGMEVLSWNLSRRSLLDESEMDAMVSQFRMN